MSLFFTPPFSLEHREHIYSFCHDDPAAMLSLRKSCRTFQNEVDRYENYKIGLISKICLRRINVWLFREEVPLSERYRLYYQLALVHYKKGDEKRVREAAEKIGRLHQLILLNSNEGRGEKKNAFSTSTPRILTFLLSRLTGKMEEEFREEFQSGKKAEEEINFLELLLTFLNLEDRKGGAKLLSLFVPDFLEQGLLATNTLPLLAFFYRKFGFEEEGKELYEHYLESPKLFDLPIDWDEVYHCEKDFNGWLEKVKEKKKRFSDQQISTMTDSLLQLNCPLENVIKLVLQMGKSESRERKLAAVLGSLSRTECHTDFEKAKELIEKEYEIEAFNNLIDVDVSLHLKKQQLIHKWIKAIKNPEELMSLDFTARLFSSFEEFPPAMRVEALISIYSLLPTTEKQ